MNNDYSSQKSAAINTHRAVLYAAGIPGWGEYLAGARLQGLVTLLAFLASTAAFCWAVWLVAQPLISFTSPSPPTVAAMGASLLAMLAFWLWGIFNAARTARQARISQGVPPQCSPAWGAIFSWVCPGSGQAYAGKSLFGFMLLLLSIASTALLAPAYLNLGKGIQNLLQNPAIAHAPLLVASRIEELFFTLHHSLPNVFLEGIKMFSIADAVMVLHLQRMEQESIFTFDATVPAKRPWYAGNEAKAGGLFILGWLAPGAGQLCIGRNYGWIFLGLFCGGQILLAFALRLHLVAVPLAMTFSWGPTLVMLAAMVEAPFRLLTTKALPPGDTQGVPQ